MPYHEITGNICRPTYNMTTKQVGYSNILGVKDALVTFGGSFAVTDENGDFTVPGIPCNFRNVNQVYYFD